MPHKDPEKKAAYLRQWQQANPAKMDSYRQKYAESHGPRDNTVSNTNRRHKYSVDLAYAEKRRGARRLYDQQHPQLRTIRKHRHEAKKAGALQNDFSHAQWLEIQETQDHRCCYCGKRCKGHLTQDHITPIADGGSHTLHNIIGACGPCNRRKGVKAPPCPVQPLLLTLAPPKRASRQATARG